MTRSSIELMDAARRLPDRASIFMPQRNTTAALSTATEQRYHVDSRFEVASYELRVAGFTARSAS